MLRHLRLHGACAGLDKSRSEHLPFSPGRIAPVLRRQSCPVRSSEYHEHQLTCGRLHSVMPGLQGLHATDKSHRKTLVMSRGA